MKIQKNVLVDVDLHPYELADTFMRGDTRFKVEFFNALAVRCISKELLAVELQAVCQSDALDPDGNFAMQKIKEFYD